MTTRLPWIEPGAPFPVGIERFESPADFPGLVAAGGDLRAERLMDAYRLGLFPWYSEGQAILWWSPDPRMVLQVQDFRLHRSLRKAIQAFLADPSFALQVNHAFAEVMQQCAAPRQGQSGTWIGPDILAAYGALHRAGHAHSFEIWLGGRLCAGLYGVNIGRMFYGESMFTTVRDGSKAALFALVCACKARDVEWIDCQQDTPHLATLGARPVSRTRFLQHITQACAAPAPGDWAYDRNQLAYDLNAHVAT